MNETEGNTDGREVDRRSAWHAPPRPEWLAALNREGAHFDLKALVPLGRDSLIDTVCRLEHVMEQRDSGVIPDARQRMEEYLAGKPREKFGVHRYAVGGDELAGRRFFRKYQQSFDVPDEV